MQIKDPEQIFTILLWQNMTSLLKSNQSIFANGFFFEKVGFDAELDGADQVLEGTLTPLYQQDEYLDFQSELKDFILEMRYPKDDDGNRMEPMQWFWPIWMVCSNAYPSSLL